MNPHVDIRHPVDPLQGPDDVFFDIGIKVGVVVVADAHAANRRAAAAVLVNPIIINPLGKTQGGALHPVANLPVGDVHVSITLEPQADLGGGSRAACVHRFNPANGAEFFLHREADFFHRLLWHAGTPAGADADIMPIPAFRIFFQWQPADRDHANSENRQEEDEHSDLAAEGQSCDLSCKFVGLHRYRAWSSGSGKMREKTRLLNSTFAKLVPLQQVRL